MCSAISRKYTCHPFFAARAGVVNLGGVGQGLRKLFGNLSFVTLHNVTYLSRVSKGRGLMDFCSVKSVCRTVLYMYSTHPLATASLTLQVHKAYTRET